MDPYRQSVLMIEAPGRVGFRELALASPGPSDVVVKPHLSAFKHGTEMMAYSGASPFAGRTFNPELRVFEDRLPEARFFPRAAGSMMVGEVVSAGRGAGDFAPGQRVYAWAPIADIHILAAANVFALGDLTAEQALCIDPACFGLGAVLDGGIQPSDRVLVTGLGAIGLFAVQYARACGAQVFAASHFAARRALVAGFGASVLDPAAEPDVARPLKQEFGGVDAAIECSGNIGTLQTAIRAVRQCGRVVCVGFYGPADARLHLGEEFFHNRVSLLASLPAMSWDNPVRGPSALRWADLRRLVVEDFRAGKIDARGIIDPVMPFNEAARAVKRIAESPATVLKVALSHDIKGNESADPLR
jgi:2-desacetyl-2-hydroxyethyl bacteriochlorophyllide A dehydrogenase